MEMWKGKRQGGGGKVQRKEAKKREMREARDEGVTRERRGREQGTEKEALGRRKDKIRDSGREQLKERWERKAAG